MDDSADVSVCLCWWADSDVQIAKHNSNCLTFFDNNCGSSTFDAPPSQMFFGKCFYLGICVSVCVVGGLSVYLCVCLCVCVVFVALQRTLLSGPALVVLFLLSLNLFQLHLKLLTCALYHAAYESH